MRDDERAKRQERRQDLENLAVVRLTQIGFEEGAEQKAERLGQARPKPVEEIVDRQGRDVVGRLAPGAAASVQYGEVGARAEQQIPGMKIAVGTGQPMRPASQAPAGGDGRALDLFAHVRRQEPVRVRIAVEDTHQTLAVTNQLADAPLVERGLVVLHGVDLGEEARQRLGPRDVDLLQRRFEQPLEVAPVESSLHLLHELEELPGVRHRRELSRPGPDADVQAVRVPRKAVVRVVAIERLPGAIGRIVVTEPLSRASAGHYQRSRDAADGAFDLERDPVAEALGIVHTIPRRAKGMQAPDLDVVVEDASQVSRDGFAAHRRGARVAAAEDDGDHAALASRVEPTVVAPSGGEIGAPMSRTTRIGVRVPRSTDSTTEPKIMRPSPPCPWLVMTMRLAPSDSAASTIVGAAGPYQTHVFTRLIPASRRPAATPCR